MARVGYEAVIKRGSTTLVLPDSMTIGVLADRIHAVLTNVSVPGDEIVIKVFEVRED